MKTLSLTAAGVVLVHISSFSQISFWPKFGTNFSWSTYKLGYSYDPAAAKVNIRTPGSFGFYAGLAVDIGIAKHFSIRPELMYNQQNVSWHAEEISANMNSTTFGHTYDVRSESRRYITVPLNFVAHFWNLQLIAGPYLSLGLNGGHYQETITQSSLTESYSVVVSGKLVAGKVPSNYEGFGTSDLSYYNQLDFGLKVGIAYQVSRVRISIDYGQGFTNTQRHYLTSYYESRRSNVITKNKSVSLGVAYRLYR